MNNVIIYTDGAARGNPNGPGGYGVVLEYTDKNGIVHHKELSQGYKKTTNNRMELMAAIAGLEALKAPCNVTLYSDSKYLVDAFRQKWIGHAMNEKCDMLATSAADGDNLADDVTLENIV